MDPCRNLMFAPDSAAWIDIATDLGIPLIADGGFGAITPAAIARPARCSRQAVHQQLGSSEALRRSVCARFLARWSRWVDVRAYQDGIAGLLPDTEEVALWTRVWLACCAYAVSDTEVAAWVADVHATERAVVRSALTQRRAVHLGTRPQVPDGAVATVQAAVTGLRLECCQLGASFEEVRRTLDATLALIDRDSPSAVA
jgi:AcrR family transcriptional regulator